MKNPRFEIIFLALTLDWVLVIPAIGQIDFNRQVRPILANHCLQCHGPDSNNRQADLRLDTQADATQSAIVAGKPHESPLIHRIESTDPDEVMPPGHLGKPLSADQITILKDWIAQGAKYSEHWAFEPIGDSTKLLQQVTDDSNQNELPIDRFIKQSLDKAGLKLSPELSKEQFIRRVSFDLTGLPPTSEELSRLV
ncbi:MAG: c-type cytochrome domain-containing protein, partial [Planctomycetota bacterium]